MLWLILSLMETQRATWRLWSEAQAGASTWYCHSGRLFYHVRVSLSIFSEKSWNTFSLRNEEKQREIPVKRSIGCSEANRRMPQKQHVCREAEAEKHLNEEKKYILIWLSLIHKMKCVNLFSLNVNCVFIVSLNLWWNEATIIENEENEEKLREAKSLIESNPYIPVWS